MTIALRALITVDIRVIEALFYQFEVPRDHPYIRGLEAATRITDPLGWGDTLFRLRPRLVRPHGAVAELAEWAGLIPSRPDSRSSGGLPFR